MCDSVESPACDFCADAIPLCSLSCLECYTACKDLTVGIIFSCSCDTLPCLGACTCGRSQEHVQSVLVGIICGVSAGVVCLAMLLVGWRYYVRQQTNWKLGLIVPRDRQPRGGVSPEIEPLLREGTPVEDAPSPASVVLAGDDATATTITASGHDGLLAAPDGDNCDGSQGGDEAEAEGAAPR